MESGGSRSSLLCIVPQKKKKRAYSNCSKWEMAKKGGEQDRAFSEEGDE